MSVDLPIARREVDPHHRVRCLADAAVEGAMSDDPVEDAVLRYLRGDDDVPVEVRRAVQLYVDTRWRNIVEAMFLAGADVDDIHNLLEIDMLTLAVFADYLFDVTVFEDYPDRWNYVQQDAPPVGGQAAEGYDFKVVALELGIEFLRATIRPDIGVVTNAHAMSRALTTAYVRVCEDGRSRSARRAEEARKWAEVMVKTLQVGAELDAEKAPDINDLVFELQSRIVEQPVIGEIIH